MRSLITGNYVVVVVVDVFVGFADVVVDIVFVIVAVVVEEQ